jgi:hypothetical protein
MTGRKNKKELSVFFLLTAFFFLLLPRFAHAARDITFAGDDSASTSLETPVSIPALVNDFSSNPAPLEITNFVNGANGTVTAYTNGVVIYEPDPGFTGIDYFFYEVTDGDDYTNSAMVVVSVDQETPTAVADRVSTEPNTPLIIPVSELLENDYDPNGDQITITNIQDAFNGTLSCNQPCTSITFTPNPGQKFGTFLYEISDTSGNTDTAVVVVVIGSNLPYARGERATTYMEAPILIDVLGNDSGNSSLAISGVTWGAHGTLSISVDNRSITYEPYQYFTGIDTFTYTIEDASGNRATAAVTVTVNQPLDPVSHNFTSNPGPIVVNSTCFT